MKSTRELPSTAKTRGVRAAPNSLFFKNLATFEGLFPAITVAVVGRFAQTAQTSHYKQLFAHVEHRPALVPGAD